MATITLSLEEYDALRNKVEALQRQVNETEAALDAALCADPSGQVPMLVEAISGATEVVRFAVANLDPRTIRGWPHLSLRRFATLLKDEVPGMSTIIRETAMEFLIFAGQAASLERDRALNPENYPSKQHKPEESPDGEPSA